MARRPAPSPDNLVRAPDCPAPRWHRRPDDRPHEIIDAAFRVFGEHGLSRTRLEDVAREAGVSKGTIYLYFDSKESLFREVVRSRIISVIEAAEQRAEATKGEPDALRRFAVRHWEFVTSPDFQAMYRLVNSDLVHFPDLARFYGAEVIQRSLRLLVSILTQAMERGELRKMDPVRAARIFGSMFTTHAVWFERREAFGTFTNESAESVRDSLLDFFLQSLAIEPAGHAGDDPTPQSRT
ncbi:MAG: TetR/AcrR family transcriptional regulator [Gemmatimonadaceae bacterium]